MAKTVTINLDVNTKESVKNIGQLNDEMEVTLNTLGDMRKASAALEEELEKTEVGTKQYKELRKELIKVNTEIKNQELAMEALDNEQVASELKSVAGGFVDMAGGMALVGAGNESLEKVVQTMAQVEGATKIVTGAMEAYSSAMKLSSTISAAYTGVINTLSKSKVLMAAKTKIVTAAQWLWNAAISANPISLIVIAVAALIAGIVALIMNIKKVVAWFGDWKNAVLALLGPIGLAIAIYRKMSDESETAAEKAAKAEKRKREEFDKTINKLDEVIDKERQNAAERDKFNKRAVALAKAQGEAYEDLETKRVEDALNSSNVILNAEEKKSAEYVKEYNRRLGTAFETEEQILKFVEDRIKKENKLFDAQSKTTDIRIRNQIKRRQAAEEAQFAATIENEQNITNLRNKQLADEEKRTDEWKKLQAEKLKAEQELIQRSTEAWEAYDALRLEMMEESQEKEIALAQAAFDQNIKDLDDNLEAERQLRLAYEEKLGQDIAKIKRKWAMQGIDEIQKMEAKGLADQKVMSQNATQQVEEDRYQTRMDYLRAWIEAQGIEIEKWQEKNAETIANIQATFEVAATAVAGIMDITQQALDMAAEKRTAARQEQYEADSESLKNQLANRELTQKQFDTKMKLLDQKKKTEEMAERRKAFKQNKAMQIVTAVMNTAQAVLSGLSAPFPIGIAMAAVNAAIGAAQIGIIASQKFKAARGGVVPGSGPSNVDSVDAMLAPGEAVINANSAAMFPQTLSAINQAGGGISLAPELPPTGSATTETTYRDNNKPMDITAIVVESEMTDTQRRVKRNEEAAAFG